MCGAQTTWPGAGLAHQFWLPASLWTPARQMLTHTWLPPCSSCILDEHAADWEWLSMSFCNRLLTVGSFTGYLSRQQPADQIAWHCKLAFAAQSQIWLEQSMYGCCGRRSLLAFDPVVSQALLQSKGLQQEREPSFGIGNHDGLLLVLLRRTQILSLMRG